MLTASREKDDSYYYTHAEIGFPSSEEPLINDYAEDPSKYTETVYSYVPCELIDKVIEKHGGIDEMNTFEWEIELIIKGE